MIFFKKFNVYVISLLVVILTGCNCDSSVLETPAFTSPENQKTYIDVSVQGNLNNGGTMVANGEWIYYAGKKGLYKVKEDGTCEEKICDDIPERMAIVNDWIYYIRDYQSIYRVTLDGKKRQRLTDKNEEVATMFVDGSYVFYSVISENRKTYCTLKKMKTDGTKKQNICKGDFPDLYVENGWLYYGKFSCDNLVHYRVKIDGTKKQKLSGEHFYWNRIVAGDWIYGVFEERFYKIKINGKDYETLATGSPGIINMKDNWIYYTEDSDAGRIYKIDKDGLGKTKLCNDKDVRQIYIINNWLYYYSNDSKNRYRIKLDGNCRERCKWNWNVV